MTHDPDRSPLMEAQMILQGLTGVQPTIEHLRAIEEHYECRIITVVNKLEALKRDVLNDR